MKKIIFNLGLLIATFQLAMAQNTSTFFLEVGGNVTSFQDEKFSDIIYSGGGLVLNLGFQKEKTQSIIGGGLNINASFESAATHDKGDVKMVHPRFYVEYLKKVSPKLAIGAHWDILGMYYRNIDGLDNNGNYYQTASDLMIASQYQFGKFRVGADLGILSLVKEGTGFAFSAPQNGLEDGEFNYQNESLESPFGFKYGTVKSPFNHLKIRTNVQWQMSKGIALGYQWEMRRFAEVKDRSVTSAIHNVTIRFNLTHKEKGGGVSN